MIELRLTLGEAEHMTEAMDYYVKRSKVDRNKLVMCGRVLAKLEQAGASAAAGESHPAETPDGRALPSIDDMLGIMPPDAVPPWDIPDKTPTPQPQEPRTAPELACAVLVDTTPGVDQSQIEPQGQEEAEELDGFKVGHRVVVLETKRPGTIADVYTNCLNVQFDNGEDELLFPHQLEHWGFWKATNPVAAEANHGE